MRLALTLIAAVTTGKLFAGLIEPFFIDFNPDCSTAYHSRGRISEDRPVVKTLAKLGFDTKDYGDFGKFGLWNFTVSSLTDRRSSTYHRAFNEVDHGFFWAYHWDFGEYGETWKGWGLATEVLKDWLTFKGYHASARATKSDASTSEWRVSQSLVNPYLTPFYLMRRGCHPDDWLYFRVGARRNFAITDTLTFRPEFYVENGNDNIFQLRYGQKADGGRYHSGPMALNLILGFNWKISSFASFYAGVHEFHVINEDAIDNMRRQNKRGRRSEYTIATVGLRLSF